jgi:phospholipid/cholesterol/gamma-HCH transport system permease protein
MLAAARDFEQSPAPDGTDAQNTADEGDGSTYRMAGSITIARAASTAREIEAEPDPLTIDLSQVERMDTVGAWLVYRTVRDRNAKVVGASEESQSLLDQVAEADKPAKVRPEEPGGFIRVLRELGEWVAEAGSTPRRSCSDFSAQRWLPSPI